MGRVIYDTRSRHHALFAPKTISATRTCKPTIATRKHFFLFDINPPWLWRKTILYVPKVWLITRKFRPKLSKKLHIDPCQTKWTMDHGPWTMNSLFAALQAMKSAQWSYDPSFHKFLSVSLLRMTTPSFLILKLIF